MTLYKNRCRSSAQQAGPHLTVWRRLLGGVAPAETRRGHTPILSLVRWDFSSPIHRDWGWETSLEPVPIRDCGNQAWGWRVALSPVAAGTLEWSQSVPREKWPDIL